MKMIVVALVACLGLLVAACSAKRSLVGKWEEIDGTEKMEFLEGGGFTVSSGRMTASGKYSLPDETHIKVELGGLAAMAGAQIQSFAISDGVLSLTSASGKVSTYRKVP